MRVCRSTLGLRTAMQQQYQLTFTMPLAPPVKQTPQDDLKLPDDLAGLQMVCSHRTAHVELPYMIECLYDQQHSSAREIAS